MQTEQPPVRRPWLVTSSPDRAEEWANALDAAGVDVLVEITDVATGDPGSSPLVGIFGTRPLEFVHLVTIPPSQRDLAVRALLDAGWDGREGLRQARTPNMRQVVTPLLWALGGIVAFLAIRAAVG